MREIARLMNFTGNPLRFLLARPLESYSAYAGKRRKRRNRRTSNVGVDIPASMLPEPPVSDATGLLRDGVVSPSMPMTVEAPSLLTVTGEQSPYDVPVMDVYSPTPRFSKKQRKRLAKARQAAAYRRAMQQTMLPDAVSTTGIPSGGNMMTPNVSNSAMVSPQSTLSPPPIYDAPPSAPMMPVPMYNVDTGEGLEEELDGGLVSDEEFLGDKRTDFNQAQNMESYSGTLITDYNAFSACCDRCARQPLGAWLGGFSANPDINPTAGRTNAPVKSGVWGTIADTATTYFTARNEAAATKAKMKADIASARRPVAASGPSPLWLGVGILGLLLVGVAAFKK